MGELRRGSRRDVPILANAFGEVPQSFRERNKPDRKSLGEQVNRSNSSILTKRVRALANNAMQGALRGQCF